jgi:hypothetical protein
MVYCRTPTPYSHPTHLVESDTQAEVMEIAMHLEATPGGGETSVGLVQVQYQLANLTMQLQDMDKVRWCMRMCGVLRATHKGHHRNECPTLGSYMVMGMCQSISKRTTD